MDPMGIVKGCEFLAAGYHPINVDPEPVWTMGQMKSTLEKKKILNNIDGISWFP